MSSLSSHRLASQSKELTIDESEQIRSQVKYINYNATGCVDLLHRLYTCILTVSQLLQITQKL